MPCPACCPWNLPLFVKVPHGGNAMPYAEWLKYRLHVQMHQQGEWPGEIEAVSYLLRTDPRFTLVIGHPLTEVT